MTICWMNCRYSTIEARMSLEKQNIENVLPITAMQSGMLYHSLSQPNSGSYVQTLSATLDACLLYTSDAADD